jgi:hypothetical protein
MDNASVHWINCNSMMIQWLILIKIWFTGATLRLKVSLMQIFKLSALKFNHRYRILEYIKTSQVNYGMANMEMQVFTNHKQIGSKW